MKKTHALLLVLVMVLSLCACGAKKETQLTLDNYKDYLTIEAVGTTSTSYDDSVDVPGLYLNNGDYCIGGAKFTKLAYYASVEGASSNFNYNNVVIKIRVFGTYEGLKNAKGFPFVDYQDAGSFPFDHIFEVRTNIAGIGESTWEYEEIPDNMCTESSLVNDEYEIVEISGTVSPAQ